MQTKIVTVTEENKEQTLKEAGSILKAGGLVAFPTETVYGLGGDGLNKDASAKIYAAKGRPSDNPLIIHIGDLCALDVLVKNRSEEADKLIDAFWPGPMTLIFEKADIVPKETTGGLNTVAIRYPSHPLAMELLRDSGVYIAAPSANLSGRPSPTMAQHVIQDLEGRIDMILDGGSVDIGLESTIIDVSVTPPVILRPGYITEEMVEKVLLNITVDPATLKKRVQENFVAKAPGMKYKHYAPKGELTIVEGPTYQEVSEKINELVAADQKRGVKTAVIATKETKQLYDAPVVKVIGSREDEASIARGLFAILRQMDDLQVDTIYCESFDTKELGQAIMNRLLKAAGYKVISL